LGLEPGHSALQALATDSETIEQPTCSQPGTKRRNRGRRVSARLPALARFVAGNGSGERRGRRVAP
jgi:hypothetical protein